MRPVNQECAKQDILAELDQNSCLLVMDWAMKFLQLICMAREGSAGTSLAYLEIFNCKVRFFFLLDMCLKEPICLIERFTLLKKLYTFQNE